MKFMESYKRMEKLCCETMSVNEKGITAYIEEMKKLTAGVFLVKGWNDDLKQLKHYRWIRNQIAHNPDCSEENMTTPTDAEWLDDFHARIMNQTDPLALYRKATQPHPKAAPPASDPEPACEEKSKLVSKKKAPGIARIVGVFLFCMILLAAAVIIFLACSEMVRNLAALTVL